MPQIPARKRGRAPARFDFPGHFAGVVGASTSSFLEPLQSWEPTTINEIVNSHTIFSARNWRPSNPPAITGCRINAAWSRDRSGYRGSELSTWEIFSGLWEKPLSPGGTEWRCDSSGLVTSRDGRRVPAYAELCVVYPDGRPGTVHGKKAGLYFRRVSTSFFKYCGLLCRTYLAGSIYFQCRRSVARRDC